MTKTLKQNLLGIVLGGAIVSGSLFSVDYFYERVKQFKTPEVKEAIQIQRTLKRNPSPGQETENAINASARYSQLLSQDKTLPQQVNNYERFSNYQLGSIACFWSFLSIMVVPNLYGLAKRVFPRKSPLETRQLRIMD